MCLQCCTDAVVIKKDILPGYVLVRASKDCDIWKEGQFGLVQENDPDFIWDNPGPNPLDGMTDNEINDCPPEKWKESVLWMKKVELIEKEFETDPMMGYQFVTACRLAGYDPEKEGYNVVMWFIHFAAIQE
jgi:hypothetical protein